MNEMKEVKDNLNLLYSEYKKSNAYEYESWDFNTWLLFYFGESNLRL